MHKKTAKIIKKMVDESPYNNHCFTCEIHPKKTGGFWSISIRFRSKDNVHSHALLNSLKNIGWVYGEDLNIEDKGEILTAN